METTFEHNLVQNLQPIKYFVLASAIYTLFDTGIYDILYKRPSNIDSLVKALELDKNKLSGFIQYLINESILINQSDLISLTSNGKKLHDSRGWYQLFIGGYGETFLQIPLKLTSNSGPCSRNDKQVGVGSCNISRYDAFPLTKKLMNQNTNRYTHILDIGCGSAAYLIEFCKYFPEITAIGIEPDVKGYQEASRLIKNSGYDYRVKIINENLQNFFNYYNDKKPDLVIVSFVLHEVLGQSGEGAVIKFINQIFEKYPDIHLLVIEVDNQEQNEEIMKHGLANSYYNPYYLLHYFTNQKLEKKEYWDNLFIKLGLKKIAYGTTDLSVDSTGLEIGYLLSKDNA